MRDIPVSVHITVRQGKAYIPVTYGGGRLKVSGEPLFVTDLALDSLVDTIGKVKAFGNPPVQLPSAPEELREWIRLSARRAPELNAAGVRTWREFAKGARAYYIAWLDDKIALGISGAATKGGAFLWETFQEFPPDTPLRVVVEALLEEIHQVPELVPNGV